MENKRIVYITGCLGFIGSYITLDCLNKGWYVKGVDKMTYAANKLLLKEFQKYENFSFIECDINDLKFLYECDYIINTAAETHVGNSITNSNEFINSNINGVYNLLELIRNYRQETNKSPILIQFSTDEVYGDITHGEHKEDDILKPSNPYSATKASADMLILAWNRTYDISYVIVRPTNNYGIGQYVEKLIPKSIKYLNIGKKIPLHNEGTPIRNWLHAQDTSDAIITIIEKGVENEIYNISGEFEQSNLDIICEVIKEYGLESPYKYLDFSYSRIGQDVRYALNDSKLRKIGWEPKMKFDKELSSIVKYYKNKFIW